MASADCSLVGCKPKSMTFAPNGSAQERAAARTSGVGRPELVGQYFDHNAKDNPPLFDALAKCRDIAVREGWCYQHVQAIIVANRPLR